jgi:hypothetical protein
MEMQDLVLSSENKALKFFKPIFLMGCDLVISPVFL